MKKSLALIAFLVSSVSFAAALPTADMDLKTIAKFDNVQVSGNTIFLGATRMAATAVCMEDADTFRTIAKHKQYKDVVIGRTSRGDDRTRRVLVKTDFYRFPVTYTSRRQECANNDKRCRWVEFETSQDVVREIKVSEIKYHGNRNDSRPYYLPLFSKTYEIPACK